MVTDRPPRKAAHLAQFTGSDQFKDLGIPPDEVLRLVAARMEAAMKAESRSEVESACIRFLSETSLFYNVGMPDVSVLAARPLRSREGWTSELFGDYSPQTKQIRIWMRTAVRKQVTSFGTFLSTLCHEFCHHLDCQRFGFRQSPHTRGFYQRTAVLYHHARGTPPKQLVWVRMPKERWRIDWQRMRASSADGRVLEKPQLSSSDL